MLLNYLMFVILATTSLCEDIIRHDFETPDDSGRYRWALQTENNIFHEQRGSLTDDGLIVEGQYQFTSPDGQVFNIQYRSDKNGFRPHGDHIPTPPPVPPLIQQALKYLKEKTV